MRDLSNEIKISAMVIGLTKTEIEKLIREELKGDDDSIREALKYLWELFQGRERMPRRVIRAGRKENNLTFSKILKKRLR
jgi:hypothetical protein